MTFGDGVPILMICKGKPMKIFNGGGGIQVGSMWDPCGIRMDFNGILLRIKWDPCGIPGRRKRRSGKGIPGERVGQRRDENI